MSVTTASVSPPKDSCLITAAVTSTLPSASPVTASTHPIGTIPNTSLSLGSVSGAGTSADNLAAATENTHCSWGCGAFVVCVLA